MLRSPYGPYQTSDFSQNLCPHLSQGYTLLNVPNPDRTKLSKESSAAWTPFWENMIMSRSTRMLTHIHHKEMWHLTDTHQIPIIIKLTFTSPLLSIFCNLLLFNFFLAPFLNFLCSLLLFEPTCAHAWWALMHCFLSVWSSLDQKSDKKKIHITESIKARRLCLLHNWH